MLLEYSDQNFQNVLKVVNGSVFQYVGDEQFCEEGDMRQEILQVEQLRKSNNIRYGEYRIEVRHNTLKEDDELSGLCVFISSDRRQIAAGVNLVLGGIYRVNNFLFRVISNIFTVHKEGIKIELCHMT